jgi:CubicO group peptidase (beta-lactamase class C family)
MDLVSQGKLSLDAPIRQYLPELPDAYRAITLRHLLDHQSGIIHEGAQMFFSMQHYATTRDALKVFVHLPLRFEPGKKTDYSSPAFAVAGAAAEAVTGRSFQQLSADFFAAHGIRGVFLDDIYAIVPNRVRGYSVDRDSVATFQDGTTATHQYLAGTPGAVTNARNYDISSRYPAGGFDSSAEDLMKFVIGVGTGKVLSPESVRQMWTAQATSDGKRGMFGLGWGVAQRDGRSVVGMNGATASTTTSLLYFPDSGVGIALLCNAEGAKDLSKLQDDVINAVFK